MKTLISTIAIVSAMSTAAFADDHAQQLHDVWTMYVQEVGYSMDLEDQIDGLEDTIGGLEATNLSLVDAVAEANFHKEGWKTNYFTLEAEKNAEIAEITDAIEFYVDQNIDLQLENQAKDQQITGLTNAVANANYHKEGWKANYFAMEQHKNNWKGFALDAWAEADALKTAVDGLSVGSVGSVYDMDSHWNAVDSIGFDSLLIADLDVVVYDSPYGGTSVGIDFSGTALADRLELTGSAATWHNHADSSGVENTLEKAISDVVTNFYAEGVSQGYQTGYADGYNAGFGDALAQVDALFN